MAIAANFPTVRPSILLDFSNQTVLDPRVTFARTTTALFYDNKSAALAEQNLLLYSNTLTNAYWLPLGATVAQNVTDPAGTASGAYTLTATNTTNYHNLGMTASSVSFGVATYTISAYLQAGTNSYVSLIINSGSSNYVTATFNLPTGLSQAVVSSGNMAYVAGSVLFTQIGSTSWYRCSFQFTNSATQTGGMGVQINNTATPTIGNYGQQAPWLSAAGTETILAYGFQIEQAKNLTTYTPSVYTATTSAAVNTYTPTLQVAAINAPRFDYNPTTRESLGLFTEQASTNLALYSSDYTNAAWTKTGSSITATSAISPDGSQNASLMVLGTTSVAHILYTSSTYTAATWTVSVYVKYYGQQFFQIYSSANGNVFCNFDLINGLKGTPSGSGSPTADIQNVGNGWYRCSLTLTALAGAANFIITASNSLTATVSPSFAGNGFNGYLVWGAQVEQAPSATSYIANTAGTATTRTVDSASMTGTNFTSWYNYSGGTVYVEAATGYVGSASPPSSFVISDGTSANYLEFLYTALGVTTVARVNAVTLQSLTVNLPSATVANAFYKSAWYLSGAGNGVSSAGQTATTYSTAIVAPAVNQLNIGSLGTAVGNPPNGRIKKFAYYPLALTNTQIQSLSAN
jgi:hypothetical protein